MLKRLLNFIGWPVIAGVMIALLALLLFPQLRGGPSLQHRPGPGMGVVSYADAVSRAAPAVGNIYTEKRIARRYQNFYNNPFFRQLYDNSNIPLQ